MRDTKIREWVIKRKQLVGEKSVRPNYSLRRDIAELEEYLVMKGFSIIGGVLHSPTGKTYDATTNLTEVL